MAELIKSVEAETAKISSEIKAYCLKCKKQILVNNPETKQTQNKRSRISGECPECNKKVSQFLKSENSSPKPSDNSQESAKILADKAQDVATHALKSVESK